MLCKELMKSDVKCISPNDTVQEAARRMRDENIGFLPVCDDSKRVLGTVTDRDLAIRVLADGAASSTPVDDVITREAIACHPDDDVMRAEELMARHHKSRVMCVDDSGRLVGVISLSDVAQQDSGNRAAQTLRDVSEREVRM
jgi:CBS domain-containing protein